MENDDKFIGGWDDKAHFKVPTGQWPWEIFEAKKIVQDQYPMRIVEIGCLYGGTLAIWLECLANNPKAVVIGIDPEIDKVREYVSDRKLMLVKEYSKSLKAINAVEVIAPIDVLFIDGDHSYEGSKFDFLTYGRMVKKGGLIVLHDIVTFRPEVGVPRLWQEIKLEYYGTYHTQEIIGKHEPELGGGIGIVYK